MHNVGLAWFAGPGREGIDHSGRIPSFLLLRNFEGDERMRRRCYQNRTLKFIEHSKH